GWTRAAGRVASTRLRLGREGTRIEMAGGATIGGGAISLRLLGDANLGLLQGFLRDVRAGGVEEVQAELQGTMDAPVLSGTALIQDGRLRYGGLPHSVDAINGLARFDTTGVSIDGVTARVGGGPVTFGGR